MSHAPIDELRALPPPLARAVLDRIAAEHGPEAVAALRWQIEAHRRPAQRIPTLDEIAPVTVITGEYGTGKTQVGTWITLTAILDWKVERPRIVAATREKVRDTLVDGPSGLLSWLPPWISREWQTSLGHAGLLRIGGVEISCLSADAGANAIGSGAGWVLFDDYAQCVETLGEKQAEAALVAAFKSLREWPGRMLLPTTPDGAEMVRTLASSEGIKGVEVIDLGRTEENAGNLSRAYVQNIVPGLRAMGVWQRSGGGAFDGIDWKKLRAESVPRLRKVRIAIDPAKSSRSKSCEVGIVATGLDDADTIIGLADRSAVLSAEQWPSVAHDLYDELRAEYPHAEILFIVENNAGGDAPAALLRAEEKIRNLRKGRPGVSVIEVREVTARRNDGKARRASPIVALAKGGQLRMSRGLGILEGQLSKLVDEGTGTDRADAFVWGARDLAGITEAAPAVENHRAAFAGLSSQADRMPRVDFDLDRA